jgi:hypothetical protein
VETAPSKPAQVAGLPKTIKIGTAVLPVQPKITNSNPVVAQDLAAMIPSAPVHERAANNLPAPSETSGVLSRLSASLAGTVVPPVYSAPTLSAVGLILTLTLIISLTWLSLGRVVITFGAWLRRGGYAHAARSDVAAATFSSLFATPLKLSYGMAGMPHQGSFLMVSDIKTLVSVVPNAFRKEEKR